jgi:hypothetical protein
LEDLNKQNIKRDYISPLLENPNYLKLNQKNASKYPNIYRKGIFLAFGF